MKYRFVLGIGRSGTTLLGRIVAFSATPMRFASEPFHGLKVHASPERPDTNCVLPGEADRVTFLRDSIVRLGEGLEGFRADRLMKVERDDAGADVLLIKEVHSLLAFPEIVRGLDHRTAVITRDTTRVLDSYLIRYKAGNDKYLVGEHSYLARYLGGRDAAPNPLLDAALSGVSRGVKAYLKRPKWLTSVPMRAACTMEVIRHFLTAWAGSDDAVIHVPYEELCLDPIGGMKGIYDFFDLAGNEETVRRIRETTSGESTEYYATDKDSRKVLTQDYRMLKERQVAALHRMVGRG